MTTTHMTLAPQCPPASLEDLDAMDRTQRVAYGIARYGRRVPMLERPAVLQTPKNARPGDIIRGTGGWYTRVLMICIRPGGDTDHWTCVTTEGDVPA